jgi:hypothetical protein
MPSSAGARERLGQAQATLAEVNAKQLAELVPPSRSTYAVSGFEQGGKNSFVGAYTVVINKMTGQLLCAEATTANDESIFLDTTVRGK